MKKKYIKPIIKVIEDDEPFLAAASGFGGDGDDENPQPGTGSGDEEHPGVKPPGSDVENPEELMTKGNGLEWDIDW